MSFVLMEFRVFVTLSTRPRSARPVSPRGGAQVLGLFPPPRGAPLEGPWVLPRLGRAGTLGCLEMPSGAHFWVSEPTSDPAEPGQGARSRGHRLAHRGVCSHRPK